MDERLKFVARLLDGEKMTNTPEMLYILSWWLIAVLWFLLSQYRTLVADEWLSGRNG